MTTTNIISVSTNSTSTEVNKSSSASASKLLVDEIVAKAVTIILGKEHQIRLSICCLLARGHLLIEDIPGVGKTVLAHVLAQTLGLSFQRIQFTSDLLPADILGVSVFERERLFQLAISLLLTEN